MMDEAVQTLHNVVTFFSDKMNGRCNCESDVVHEFFLRYSLYTFGQRILKQQTSPRQKVKFAVLSQS